MGEPTFASWILLAVVCLFSCGDKKKLPPAPEKQVRQLEFGPIMARRPLTTESAFDIIPVADGHFLLAWAAVPEEGGGIRTIRLNARGLPVSNEVAVATELGSTGSHDTDQPPSVTEVVLAQNGASVLLSWIREGGKVADVGYAISTNHGGRFGVPVELGKSNVGWGNRGFRGQLAAAMNVQGSLSTFSMAWQAPCVRSKKRIRNKHLKLALEEQGCADLHVIQLSAETGDVKQHVTRQLPAPCPSMLSFFYQFPGTDFPSDGWLGVCTDLPWELPTEDAIVTTSKRVHQVQSRPSSENPLSATSDLGECPVVGWTSRKLGTWLIAQACSAKLQITELDAQGTVIKRVSDVRPEARCENGKVLLAFFGRNDGQLVWKLDGPQQSIQGFLPKSIADMPVRALWTGNSLLLASRQGSELNLARYECGETQLVRTDIR